MEYLLLIVFFISLLLHIFISHPAFAQDFDYQKSYQDYQYNLQLYRTSHDEYVSAKSAYLNYKTLTSENTALEATRKMLKSRSEVIRTYLTALRMKLKETTGILDYQQNLYFLKLDNETTWLTSHNTALDSPLSLTELFDQSAQLETKYPTTELLSLQTLAAILAFKENHLRDQAKIEAQQLRDKLEEMKKEGEDTSRFEQWLKQADQKFTASEEKVKLAETLVGKIRADDREKQNKFVEVRKNFEQANQLLKEGVAFLQETARDMKYE